MTEFRRPIYFNPSARSWAVPRSTSSDLAARFHRQLPNYQPTKLFKLDDAAKEIGVRNIFLKDESSRLGLTSFKILGASWGTFRAIARELGLTLEVDLETMKHALAQKPLTLYAATDGNHGRAVARMGAILSLPVEIHVPANLDIATIELIRTEGANILVSEGNYDTAIRDAETATRSKGGLLIQDFSFEGYEEIPQWIIDGYGTMLQEIDEELRDTHVDLVVVPVGVGSFAHAVVSHYKSKEDLPAILTVEPDTAACLWKSFRRGKIQPEQTAYTTLAGLDCGTVSSISWPLLQSGVDASLTVSDYEAHTASLYLKEQGISAGPCGASTLAALRRLSVPDKAKIGLDHKSVIVLLSTEGVRDYNIPPDVSVDDPVALTQTLVQINSANPSLGSVPGPGETNIARYIAAWLEHRDIETHWIEPTKGRPSIVGVVRGSGGGKSLMFNGHIDTVTTIGYEGNPLGGEIHDGKLYGRGAADMKCGLAAALIALANTKKLGLRGDVVFAGVADEEAESIGTEQVLQAGWITDAAIVSEPSGLNIVHAHKGFVWLEVDIHGRAAHGSLPELGIDAISKAGYFLVELDRYAQQLRESTIDSGVGPPSVHVSIIKGGEEASSYPALCTIVLERRTVPGETPDTVKAEIQALLEKISDDVQDFQFDLRVTFNRSPFSIPRDDPFVSLVGDVVNQTLGTSPIFRKDPYWTDCALLADAGISPILWGPDGEGLHAKEEWVDINSIRLVSKGLTEVACKFCR
ncbi:acetylornithine deacetylase [Annulohypoxylon truncatum]|uniref:acetylornithine deacetylase n=1 Tax=Annulohypoxylon truncatum TaxID=327061 RepID=UPI00200786FD|nr:acetylornithine deacetylase [Annulohypoxylon truncatum]KAI1214725.1 acetylornithine deacetylase [Annulohypoxylon truncatum]